MKGKFRERATPLMISAMRMACSSLSITHGPAMRNSLPAPILTWLIWKDTLIGGERCLPASRGIRAPNPPAVSEDPSKSGLDSRQVETSFLWSDSSVELVEEERPPRSEVPIRQP